MTKIEWCDETWNPIIGCSKISEGCQNCYAEKMANRLRHMEKNRPPEKRFYTNVVGPAGWNNRTHFMPERLSQPSKWKKPRKIFVCSMSDLFYDAVPLDQINSVFIQMLNCDWHAYLLLTKRPERMKGVIEIGTGWRGKLLNLWLGVTTETQDRYDERWSILGNNIPAAVKFVSIEPALEYVNIDIFAPWPDWVIWGPETGPGKRPYKDEWAEVTYEQCREKNIPFFDKRKNYLAREFPT